MKTIPLLIQRCLAYAIEIYPYELPRILEQYEDKKIPDCELGKLTPLELRKYIYALNLSSAEDSCDWTRGHSILKELGFVEKSIPIGHRSFISLVYKNKLK